MVPYLDARPQAQAPDVDDFEDPQRWDPEMDLTKCTDIAGLLHIIHNAGRGLETKLEHYSDSYLRLQKLSNMLRHAETKLRLKTTCFNTSVGEELFTSSGLQRFRAQCYTDRWTTVADCVIHMSKDLKAALDWGWSLTSYRFGDSSALPSEEDHADYLSRLDLIDDALVNRYWWSYWNMLQKLAGILVEATAWAESCPCHSDLLRDIRSGAYDDGKGGVGRGSLADIARAALKCPLRGRRCAELASGDFQTFIDKLCNQQAGLILLDMDSSLTDDQKMMIMRDFERGRQHLITQFTIKLSNWAEGRWHMHGMAHHDPVKAYACYLKTLDSTDDHPLLLELRDKDLEEERKLFERVKGCLASELTPRQCVKLRVMIARCRLAPSAERKGERPHAVVHKDMKRCPNHSCALVSLANTFPEISQFVTKDSLNLMSFAKTMQQVRHGRDACRKLGFADHPGSKAVSKGRGPLHFTVIYRADAWSKC